MSAFLRAGHRWPQRVVSGISLAASGVLIACVRGYQVAIAPLLIGSCKFAPTCSEYFIQAIRIHGPIHGALMGFWRICRCNPFGAGGIDPVPQERSKRRQVDKSA